MAAPLLLLFPWIAGTTTLANEGLDDDTIQLGSQILAVTGSVEATSVAEFEAGIKIGPATYDNREHAFYIVMDDFSGGFGTRFQRIRDEQGVFWDGLDNASDTRRSRHITLPPRQADVSMSGLTAGFLLPGVHKSALIEAGNYVFGRGNKLYTLSLSTLGTPSITPVYTSEGPNFVGVTGLSALEGRTSSTSQGSGVVIAGTPGGGSSQVAYVSIGGGHQSNTGGTVGRRFFASFFAGRYVTSTNGVSWSNGAVDKDLGDIIYWSGKILAVHSRGIIYAVWDADTNQEVWNIDDELDGEYVGLSQGPATDYFIGAAPAPWGEPAMYLYNYDKLYVLDFYARKMYPIDVGMGRAITDACVWNGSIYLTDGWNIFEYNASGNSVRNIGLPNKDGLPPSIRADSFPGTGGVVHGLIPADNQLFACVTATSSGVTRSYLFCYNGIGWSQIGERLDNSVLGSGLYALSSKGHRRIVTYTAQMAIGSQVSALDHNAQVYDLPSYSNTPSAGLDKFGDSGAGHITSWQDGGFYDLQGTLLRMKIDALGLTDDETVKVEYQLDNDETAAWQQLVDSNNVPAVFDADHDTLYFSEDPDGDLRSYNPREGVAFTTARFRVTLTRGSDNTKTPELRALTLMYLKVPEFRSAWTFRIDVNRMIERSESGTETMYYVDGQPATFRRVWDKLQSIWNSHKLVPLRVPSMFDVDEPLYVRISDMPATFDDFREVMAGDGIITLTLLEPLERVPL